MNKILSELEVTFNNTLFKLTLFIFVAQKNKTLPLIESGSIICAINSSSSIN